MLLEAICIVCLPIFVIGVFAAFIWASIRGDRDV